MYGLTEAFRSTYLEPSLVDSHPDSMGTAIPFAEILVMRPDGSPAADDEPGELVHAGPLVAQGYWRDPERTAQRFRPAPLSSRYGGVARSEEHTSALQSLMSTRYAGYCLNKTN